MLIIGGNRLKQLQLEYQPMFCVTRSQLTRIMPLSGAYTKSGVHCCCLRCCLHCCLLHQRPETCVLATKTLARLLGNQIKYVNFSLRNLFKQVIKYNTAEIDHLLDQALWIGLGLIA